MHSYCIVSEVEETEIPVKRCWKLNRFYITMSYTLADTQGLWEILKVVIYIIYIHIYGHNNASYRYLDRYLDSMYIQRTVYIYISH